MVFSKFMGCRDASFVFYKRWRSISVVYGDIFTNLYTDENMFAVFKSESVICFSTNKCHFGINSALGYIRSPSAEVMIFALIVLALTFFAERNYFLSGLFVSIAGTLNIAVMALGLFMIIDFVKNTYMYHYKSGEKNVFRVILLEWKKIGLLILCTIPYYTDF